jgi:hypothetical protein
MFPMEDRSNTLSQPEWDELGELLLNFVVRVNWFNEKEIYELMD